MDNRKIQWLVSELTKIAHESDKPSLVLSESEDGIDVGINGNILGIANLFCNVFRNEGGDNIINAMGIALIEHFSTHIGEASKFCDKLLNTLLEKRYEDNKKSSDIPAFDINSLFQNFPKN